MMKENPSNGIAGKVGDLQTNTGSSRSFPQPYPRNDHPEDAGRTWNPTWADHPEDTGRSKKG